jgi:hypothetical protein
MWLMAFPGVCRASAVQGNGLRRCAGPSPGASDGLSDDDDDDGDGDDLNGSRGPG